MQLQVLIILTIMKIMEKATFKITVNDGFCSWEYPLEISIDNSIDSVMARIYKEFELPFKQGKLVKKANLSK